MKTPPGFFFTAPPGIPTGGLPMGVAWSLRFAYGSWIRKSWLLLICPEVSVVPKNENWTAIFPEIHHPMFFFQSFREFLVVFFDLEEVDGHLWGWHLRIWLAEWEHLGSATATRPSSVRRPKILMPQLICVGNGWKFWEVMVTNYVSTDFIDLVVANTVFM